MLFEGRGTGIGLIMLSAGFFSIVVSGSELMHRFTSVFLFVHNGSSVKLDHVKKVKI